MSAGLAKRLSVADLADAVVVAKAHLSQAQLELIRAESAASSARTAVSRAANALADARAELTKELDR